MAHSEFELKRINKLVGEFVDSRRPESHIRPELDICFGISGQSFEIYSKRPHWENPGMTINSPVAKATYVKKTKKWKLYWMRADLKWHRYLLPETDSLEEILKEIGDDPYCCFWG